MLLAELEVWHSRPVTPTRRVALGHLVLPVDPTPGFGGLLLGAVIAAHLPDVDEDLIPDVHRLLDLSTDAGRAMMDAIVTQQAVLLAYLNDYKLLMFLTLAVIPLIFIIGSSKKKSSDGDLEEAVVLD